MNGLISVIVSVYNAEKYLSCCVASILAQSYGNLEVLLVDDGSTDGSAALCEEWCEKDGRVRLLRQRNAGVSSARNKGLEEASGEYIAFVDADDWILPGMLEGQMDCLEREDSDLVLGGFREVGQPERDRQQATLRGGTLQAEMMFRGGTEIGKEEGKVPSGADAYVVEGKVPAETDLCVAEGMIPTEADASTSGGRIPSEADTYAARAVPPNRKDACEAKTMDPESYVRRYLLAGNTRCWSILFSRKVLERVRFRPDLTIGEDLMFLVDCLPSLRRVTVLKSREYCYYRNEEGAMYSSFRPSYMDQIRCWKLAEEKIAGLYPSCVPQAEACLFQAALLVAGKLALLPKAGTRKRGIGEEARSREAKGKGTAENGTDGEAKSDGFEEGQNALREKYRMICHEAADGAWKRLGRRGRRMLPAGYRIKGPVFLYAPRAYLRLYHVWKGRK